MSENKAVLLVDDDAKLGEFITDYLLRFGFTVTVKETPTEGLNALKDGDFAAAIFDVMLPEMDGFDLCKQVRRNHPALPILMLTARGDLTDRVVGLEIGADDYLSKPFEPRELSARLSALLRRTEQTPSNSRLLRFKGITVNIPTRRIWTEDDKEIVLSSVEFRLLAELIRRRPTIVHRNILIEEIRGFESDVFDRSIDITVSRLRAKLGDSAAKPRFIQTMRNEGYAFIASPA